ncbi:unnamed protein product [Closterium sp. NIES-65]|nr:unnamed protein product [Closterium sp. NIES-65]
MSPAIRAPSARPRRPQFVGSFRSFRLLYFLLIVYLALKYLCLQRCSSPSFSPESPCSLTPPTLSPPPPPFPSAAPIQGACVRFSLADMLTATNRWALQLLVGDGYRLMFRGVDPRDGATPWLLKRCRAREFDEFHAESVEPMQAKEESTRLKNCFLPSSYPLPPIPPVPHPSFSALHPSFSALHPLACLPRPLPLACLPPPPPPPGVPPPSPPRPLACLPRPLPLACAPSRGKQVTEMGNKNHPNLVRLLGYCDEQDKQGRWEKVVVYESMPAGSLLDQFQPGGSRMPHHTHTSRSH